MGGKTKKGKGRLDKYYHLAKEQGYRSRAAFKLIQLNRKFNFLSSCRSLLDLCAAPGGWLQVAAKNMPVASLIIGVDLVPIKAIRGVKTLIGDITTQETRAALKKEAAGNRFDVVVHDGAPNVGGAWSNEAYTQAALVLDSLKLATEFLVPQGCFVTKVFRSKDYNALLYAFNQLFSKVESTKPTASRNTSAEIFVVCQGFKAPAKIDPRLLDPKHLFQDVTEVKKVMGPDALMKQKIKQVRHRDGYEEGLSTSYKQASALTFLLSDLPVELLGKVTQLVLDGPGSWAPLPEATAALLPEGSDLRELADAVRQASASTTEIRALCRDLQVLGRTEFKSLLRWRLAVRKELKSLFGLSGAKEALLGRLAKGGKALPAADTPAPVDTTDMDPEAALLAEMAAVREAMEKRQHKEKKRTREMKKKARIRAAQLGVGQGGVDENGPDGLFSLAGALKASDGTALDQVVSMSAPGEQEMEQLDAPDSSDDDWVDPELAGDDEGMDSDEEALAYEAQLEEALERSYSQFLERKGHRDEVLQEKRKRLGMLGELDEDEAAAEAAAGAGAAEQGSDSEADDEDDDDDQDDLEDDVAQGDGGAARGKGAGAGDALKQALEGHQARLAKLTGKRALGGGGLLVELDERRAGVAKSGAAMAAQWFGQDLFDDPNLMADEDEDDEESGRQAHRSAPQPKPDAASTKQAGKAGRKAGAQLPSGIQPAEAAEGGAGEAGPGPGSVKDAAAASALGKRSASAAAIGAAISQARDGFEVVPATKRSRAGGKAGATAGADSDGSSSGTDSEDEYDMLDDQGKAEVLALAKRMLRRKEKDSIVEAAYNRYAFHDTGLPRWFQEDERRHMRPILPVTKAEVDEEKERLRVVDARPIKKVAEAKARQRKAMQGKLAQARSKAEAVAAQDDVPMSSKMREIAKLYARARSTGKGGKGKGKGGKDGKRKGRGPPLDKRMLKDKRADKARAKRDKKGGGRKGGGSGKAGGSGRKGGAASGGARKGGSGKAGGKGKR